MANITINYARISKDSLFLEFSIECPVGYEFNTFYIKRFTNVTCCPEVVNSITIDASNIFQVDPGAVKYVLRIPISEINDATSSTETLTGVMLQLEFGVTPTAGGGMTEVIPNAIALCSDVNHVYQYLLDYILNLQNGCIDDVFYDTLIKDYMFLYAHSEAMRLERFDEAALFYDILAKNFAKCSPTYRTDRLTGCNCG